MAASVRWLGHSAFHLSGGGADVLVDPFLNHNPKAAAKPDEVPADVNLLTHGHGDHLGDTVEIATRTGAVVVAIVELDTFPLVATDAEAFKQDVENAGFSQVYVLNPGDTHELK